MYLFCKVAPLAMKYVCMYDSCIMNIMMIGDSAFFSFLWSNLKSFSVPLSSFYQCDLVVNEVFMLYLISCGESIGT